MYYYRIADLIIESVCELSSYKEFVCKPGNTDIILMETKDCRLPVRIDNPG